MEFRRTVYLFLNKYNINISSLEEQRDAVQEDSGDEREDKRNIGQVKEQETLL